MVFSANDSPLAGRSGKAVTGRVIGERLAREAEASVSLRVAPLPGGTERYEVQARGEMQLAVVIEGLRREGLELAVSPPQVLYRCGVRARAAAAGLGGAAAAGAGSVVGFGQVCRLVAHARAAAAACCVRLSGRRAGGGWSRWRRWCWRWTARRWAAAAAAVVVLLLPAPMQMMAGAVAAAWPCQHTWLQQRPAARQRIEC